MKKKTVFIVLIIILLVPNLPVINKYVAHQLDEGYFKYANLDGSFIATQSFSFKSPGFSTFGFEQFIKRTSPAKENQKLFRLYKLNPLCFWRWNNYIQNGLQFEYMDRKVIEKNMQEKGLDTKEIM
ncbi:hypothetical protein [Chryseobacterium indologenes]|uniref:hypothetical protein n=1 Tax=Chryseobacterium indologenes TaxID=253 RepID=UPI0016263547|nr:hypothetical protein [Chryseobacterium indologenes]